VKNENRLGKGDVLEKNSLYISMKPFRTLFLQGLSRRKRQTFFVGFVAATFCIGSIFSSIGQAVFAESDKSPQKTQGPTDVRRLVGRWVRPDGGYILEVREVHKDGSLDAAYFNPRSIKVFEAVWNKKGGKIRVMVELRDVNYPGSTYNLRYDPKTDRLKGTYFQAVERQTYDIEFVRSK
jgi:hypothetical protein